MAETGTSKTRKTKTTVLLMELDVDQARFIAVLARLARAQRDELLGNVAEADIAETTPAKGEHNPTADLGFDPLGADAAQTTNLADAVGALSATARAELYTLMRIGQGDLAAKKWHHGLSEAALLGDERITAAMIGNPDLHDHIIKGLYAARLSW
jgi:hypothetical protein